MKKIKPILFVFLTAAIILQYGCSERQLSPIKGSLKCYVDESLYNVVKAERDTFAVLYVESHIELEVVKAREGIASVLNGEANMFVSSRNLNDEETAFAKKHVPDMRSFKFCYDAVIPIVRENDSKNEITLDEIKKILNGEKGGYTVFVPERNSGVYEYLKEYLLENQELKNVSIVQSEEETIGKVKSTKNSLGFVGLNTLANATGVKMLEVGSKVRSDGEVLYYKPYVAYLVSKTYPLLRTTTIFINEFGIGLASGFSTFMTSYEGQKIVSQNNLGPATVPIKMVY